MPNWCVNILEVVGDKSELEKFKKFAKGKKVLDENKFIPYPKKFAKLDEKSSEWIKKADKFAQRNGAKCWYCGDDLDKDKRKKFIEKHGEHPKDGYNSGGYEWCTDNWGTKWGFCRPVLKVKKDKLVYSFDSAWAPPIPLIFKMSKKFPKLGFTLTYDEPGLCFNGVLSVKNDKIIHIEHRY